MVDESPEELAARKAEAKYYTSPLATRLFEFRIRLEDTVILTCDWETYDQVKKQFPKKDGYIHEGRELTPWLPTREVGKALIPLRSQMWSILERDAKEYERLAAGQKELAETEGNRVAMTAWLNYREMAENIRRIIHIWRDNYK